MHTDLNPVHKSYAQLVNVVLHYMPSSNENKVHNTHCHTHCHSFSPPSWLMYIFTTLAIPPPHWYLPLVKVEVSVVSMWSAALLPLVVWYTVRLGEVGTVCPAPSVHVSGCVGLSVEQSMTATLLELSGGRMSPTLVSSSSSVLPLSKIMALFGMRRL